MHAFRADLAASMPLVSGQRIEPRLSLLDLLPGREVDGRVVGRVDHVLADQDELPARRQVVDGAAILAGVDDGRRLSSKATEVLRHRGIAIDRLEALEERLQRDGVGALALSV